MATLLYLARGCGAWKVRPRRDVTLANSIGRPAVLLVSGAVAVAFGGSIAGAAATRGPARVPLEARTAIASPAVTERAVDDREESGVVLVVLDGVRWQDVFEGADPGLARRHGLDPRVWSHPRDLMPNLHRLVDSDGIAVGAPGRGATMAATGPQFISFPGYLEIFAGKPEPACDRNDCLAVPGRTLLDDVAAVSGDDAVAVVASWPNIARAASAGAADYAITAGRRLATPSVSRQADDATSRWLDRGRAAGAWPGKGDYRPDAFTAKIALHYLESARPRFLFVGLGDCDEHAHHDDYPRYLESLHQADAFLGDLVGALGRMGARGRHTTVLVTADHGRAFDFKDHGPQFPESGRVFLVAIGDDVRQRGAGGAAGRHTLSDVAPTVRALLGVGGATGTPIAEIAAGPR
jgi:hypothetical protein